MRRIYIFSLVLSVCACAFLNSVSASAGTDELNAEDIISLKNFLLTAEHNENPVSGDFDIWNVVMMKKELIEIDMSKMPVIIDDYGDITDDTKMLIFQEFAKEIPDTDLSDFTLVYLPDRTGQFTKYGFEVYFKDILLYWGGGGGYVNISINRYGEEFVKVLSSYTVNDCFELDLEPRVSMEDLEQVLKDSNTIYNWIVEMELVIWRGQLAFHVMPDLQPIEEYIMDAYTGEILDIIPRAVIN